MTDDDFDPGDILSTDEERAIREIVRDEHDDLTVTDEEGTTWSLSTLTQHFEITRREALLVLGLLAFNYSLGGALRTALVDDTEAAITGGEGQSGTSSNPLQAVWTQNLHAQNPYIQDGNGFIPLTFSHTNWGSGLSNEEIMRLQLPTGKKLQVWHLETRQKAGGTSSNFDVDIYDSTAAANIAQVTLGSTKTGGSAPIGESGSGNLVLVRLTNGTGGAVTASVQGILAVVDA